MSADNLNTSHHRAYLQRLRYQVNERFATLVAHAQWEDIEFLQHFLAEWALEGSLARWRQCQQEQGYFQRLLEINKALNSRRNLQELLELIMDAAIELMQAERGFLILAGQHEIQVARNFDREAVRHPQHKFSHSIARQVLEQGQAVICADAQQEAAFQKSPSIKELQLRSVLCVPLINRGKVLGALYLDNRFVHGAFGDGDLKILCAFADQAAIALQTVQLLQELQHRSAELTNLLEQTRHQHRLQTAKLLLTEELLAEKQAALAGRYHFSQIIGESRPMQLLLRLASRAATCEMPILILGESGTGKELLARALHSHSARAQRPFVAENCAAISENLLESELFGYVQGAFTGAQRDKPGLFQLAHGGTLFLDEVGDMPPAMQAKLLRVLESGELRPVGAAHSVHVDVRLICATHRDLPQMVQQGSFRQDLYYRLRGIVLQIPPLRQRPTDIPLLIQHFLQHDPQAVAKKISCRDPQVLRVLTRYPWPGNVRQLEHELKRIVAFKRTGEIELQDLSAEILQSEPSEEIVLGLPLREAVRIFERQYIERTIRHSGGNKAAAARQLGLSRRGLYNKLAVPKPNQERSRS